MNFVLGSHGRLGRAIVSLFGRDQVTILDRPVYSDWWRDDAADHVSRFFESQMNDKAIVYLAAGLIDPRAPLEEHHRVNFLLARNVVQGASSVGLKTVTFGTVMEAVVGGKPINSYFSSKRKLSDFISDFSVKKKLALHIRMHTLYGGGLPDGFMFLGQLFHSLMNHVRFDMSPGAQLREYHHVEDEIAAISKFVEAKLNGIVDLSHGAPVKLRDLATYVFEQLECPELLNIGALPEPASDNYARVFERTPLLSDCAFRDALPSIVEYLRLCKTAVRQ